MEFDFWTVVSAILGVIAVVFGVFWAKVKDKLGKVYLLGKEALDVVRVAVDAIEDNKITGDEVEQIKKEAREVKAAFRDLLGRE